MGPRRSLVNPGGARFVPNCRRLVQLMVVTTHFNLVFGMFIAAKVHLVILLKKNIICLASARFQISLISNSFDTNHKDDLNIKHRLPPKNTKLLKVAILLILHLLFQAYHQTFISLCKHQSKKAHCTVPLL